MAGKLKFQVGFTQQFFSIVALIVLIIKDTAGLLRIEAEGRQSSQLDHTGPCLLADHCIQHSFQKLVLSLLYKVGYAATMTKH